MKVYNLQCQFGHIFEGWFRSADEFDAQSNKGILSRPVCEDNVVTRLPSAAHIQNPKSSHSSKQNKMSPNNNSVDPDLQRKLIEVAQHIFNNAENVGDKFASEARKIHQKESEERTIYGTATLEESRQLKEEGIDVMSIPTQLIKKKPKSIQ